MSGAEFILPDIPRAITALAEWLSCLLCILEMKKRFSGWKLAAAAVTALIIQLLFLEWTAGLDGFLWIICMAAASGMMYLFIFTCCDVRPGDVGYYCVRAFVVAEFAASLEWQLDCFFYYTMGIEQILFRGFLLVTVFGLVFSTIFLIYRKFAGQEEPLCVTKKELLSCVIIGLAVFAISNIGFISSNTPFGGQYAAEIFNVRTLIDLGGLAILYAYHVQRIDLRRKYELESMHNILHNQYVQYQQSQEAMDIINYKYHDLKHHIIALRAEENADRRNEYLDRMEEELHSYEGQNKTGNKVLDTLLTSKNLYCINHGITMTCVVDGGLFDFMGVMDICSIFGNALDNAIECEMKIQEQNKRLIHVTAFSQKSFLIVRFENYYEGEIQFDESLPVTTKKEAEFHGYGLKSIRFTARKYEGEVDVSVQDNWFVLKVLIPLNIQQLE